MVPIPSIALEIFSSCFAIPLKGLSSLSANAIVPVAIEPATNANAIARPHMPLFNGL